MTILRRNVPVVCGASYHLLGYQILQDSKIRFRLQVESYISDWLFWQSQLLASYVSRHKAMAYDNVSTLSGSSRRVIKVMTGVHYCNGNCNIMVIIRYQGNIPLRIIHHILKVHRQCFILTAHLTKLFPLVYTEVMQPCQAAYQCNCPHNGYV